MEQILEQILGELRELKKLTLLGVKKVITMSDAELLTGLSESSIYKLISSKKIPYHKSPGDEIVCFDRSELEEWMLRQRVESVEPIDENRYSNSCRFGAAFKKRYNATSQFRQGINIRTGRTLRKA